MTMKYAADLEKQDVFKERSFMAGVRVCDSLSTIIDDL